MEVRNSLDHRSMTNLTIVSSGRLIATKETRKRLLFTDLLAKKRKYASIFLAPDLVGEGPLG